MPRQIDDDARPRFGNLDAVEVLVCEERDDNDRHPSSQGTERRARASVAHDHVCLIEHGVLIDPCLHMHVGRSNAERTLIEATPDGEERRTSRSLAASRATPYTSSAIVMWPSTVPNVM